MDILLTNSLTRKKEKFKPLAASKVRVYTCGPTVYSPASIGNFRTYFASDILVRTLVYNGYKVKHVMNLTDVGHLTGDNEGDADQGEDRLERAAQKEQKSAWDIASQYSDLFIKDFKKLNLLPVNVMPKATDHIKEQIQMVKALEQKGLTYKIADGIYFNSKAFEDGGKKYGELSNLDEIKEGARVEPNRDKKDPRDFALWKFSEIPGERHMEWKSPWGIGFPGWHIECSAMSMKYLGETFDIHVGGEDLRSTHHPNEIAQSEGSTGKKFVNYWLHGAHLKVDGKRMGKSLGNAYTVADIEDRGIDPLALRLFYMSAHYRSSLNFTWEALKQSEVSLNRLRDAMSSFKSNTRSSLSEEKLQKTKKFQSDFHKYINDDLNMPQALSVVWSAVKSNIPSEDKYDLLISFDEVLGLDLRLVSLFSTTLSSGVRIESLTIISDKVLSLLNDRQKAKESGDYQKADKIREEVESEYKLNVLDSDSVVVLKPAKK